MNKKMVFGVFTLFVAAVVLLVACGAPPPPAGFAPGQRSEAYAYVHGGYVGMAVVTTDDKGALSAHIDEAFLPHTLAIVDIDSDQWTRENTLSYQVRGNEIFVARHVSYQGKPYRGVSVGTALAYVAADDQGNPAGNVLLDLEILRNQETMARWFHGIQEGAFAIHQSFDGDPLPVTSTAYGGVTKRDSSYWSNGSGLGWEANMNAIQDAVERIGPGFQLDEITRGNDDRWRLADVVTRATASDFKDYFGLVQAAVGRLKMK
ncbi:hypothetical protein SAMN05920897_10573 [Alkalispirochaeta americana]|uniref:Uncharacterized protein n=2 Tax=Alkalispirochaeta americana TaxID=159291 RepID=A0A1N6QW84_9SPIO|nr:hypothetical protein SAMN05920897_10573 [Alkalispirochaeta americana]